ncbi:MAG: hypothetical protein AB1751_11865 [Acidobacteriota bacterium]
MPYRGLWAEKASAAGSQQLAPASFSYWLPVVAHGLGLVGTNWRTDLGLLNRSGATANVELRFYGKNGLRTGSISVANNTQLILEDVVGQLGVYSDSGALEVRSDHPLRVTSRTYNQGSSGTYGQAIAAYMPGEGLSAGESAWLPQLMENASYRCNIGVTNTGAAPASVTAFLYDGSGNELGQYSYTLNPGEWKQERAFERRGLTDLSRAYAKVQVNSGSGVIAYASIVDNTTGDATTIAMMPEVGCGALVGRWGFGPAYAVVVSGNLAYLGSGTNLVILDLTDPRSPRPLASLDVGSFVFGLAVSGAYVFVAAGQVGLRIVDASDPTAPRTVTSFQTGGRAWRVSVSGKRAYVVGGDPYVRIIDVSNPSAPSEVGAIVTPGKAEGVAVSGNFAYVADGGQGLRVVDVSNPSAPTEVAFITMPGAALDVALAGKYAYVVDGDNGLRVIDVSNPRSPEEIGFMGGADYFVRVALAGSYAYLVGGSGALQVIDVSNPAVPKKVGFLSTPGYAEDVVAASDFVYVAASDGGLRIINVANPSLPSEVAFFDTPGEAKAVDVSGGYAYLADAEKGIRIIDVSHPPLPFEVGFVDKPGSPWQVAVSGNYAYVVSFGIGLSIIDISVATAPREIGFFTTPGFANDVAVAGIYAYVADGSHGLRILNVSDPTAPKEIGHCDTPYYASSVAVSGRYAYVADGWGGLRIIDVSNPGRPWEVGSFDTPGFAAAVAIAGDHALVVESRSGLRIVNIADPTAPWEAGFVGTSGNPKGVKVSGTYAYVVEWGSGVQIIDISNPAVPVTAGFVSTPGYTFDIAVSGNLVYVADNGAGLSIFAGCASSTYWLPVVAHGLGLVGTNWRTDLGLLNRSGATANVELRFYGKNGLRTGSISVANNTQLILEDVVGQLGVYSDSGALEVRSDHPLRVTSRTYNQGSSGTYGQAIAAYMPGEGLSAGESAWLPQLMENASYRCNIGVTNTGATPASVTVFLYDGSGNELGQYSYTLNPGEWKQERAFERRGFTDLSRAYAKVQVNSGSGVVAYASIVDNTTGDATTIRMMR